MYYLLNIITFLLKNIPRKAGYFIFDIITSFIFIFPSKRKINLRNNISAVIGIDSVNSKILLEVYKNYGRYYFDLFSTSIKFPKCVTPESDKIFKDEIVPKINALMERKKGMIIVAMHLGNWDAAGSYAAYHFPGKINMVVERLSPPMLKWFSKVRNRLGMKIIEHTDVKQMVRILHNNEILVLAADRDLDKNGFKINFFGKKAYIPSGPSKLAMLSGAPVLVGCFPRDKNNNTMFSPKCHNTVLNCNNIPRTKENIEQLAKDIIIETEELIKQYPTQWCMLQEVFVPE